MSAILLSANVGGPTIFIQFKGACILEKRPKLKSFLCRTNVNMLGWEVIAH